MKSLSLSNFRCFEQTEDIELKPLTVLVGKNSSGKSSFIRLFPLLKQSMGRQHEGVFIWYDPNGVDFNNMANTVKRGKNSITIKLTFDNILFRNYINRQKAKSSDLNITIKFCIDKKKKERIEYLILNVFDYSIKIAFTNKNKVRFFVNDKRVHIEDEIRVVKSDSFIPRFIYSLEGTNELSFSHPNSILNKILPEFDESSKDLSSIARDSSKWMNWIPGNTQFLADFLGIDQLSEKEKNKALRLYLINNINELIDAINRFINFTTQNITYIGPLRVMTERYNRETNHSIKEISSNGENLASLLSSLSQEKLNDFKSWTTDNFGFTPHVNKRDGIIELGVSLKGSDEYFNLSDLGVGYTQILPILVGIWQSQQDGVVSITTKSIIYKREQIICIEQPELHIHPAMQKQFVRLLVNILTQSKSRQKMKFIIETHSQTIISEIGQAIRELTLPQNMVSVLLFEKVKYDESNDSEMKGANSSRTRKRNTNQYFTKISQSSFDSKGYLSKWPYGFLN